MKKRVIGLGAAAVLAVLGTVLIVSRVDDASRREAAGQELATVLVMNEFVPAGTPSEELAGFVRADGVPAALVTEGAVADLADLAGLVSTTDLLANEQVTAGRFASAEEAARIGSVDVPSDMVELSVSVSPEQSVGGAVQPGETVSVVATFDAGEQPVNSVGLLLANVLVTRVQGAAPVTVDAAAATEETATPPPAPTAESLVTIAVPSADAERFVYAIHYGQIYLAREPIDPDEFVSRVTTAENVFAPR